MTTHRQKFEEIIRIEVNNPNMIASRLSPEVKEEFVRVNADLCEKCWLDGRRSPTDAETDAIATQFFPSLKKAMGVKAPSVMWILWTFVANVATPV